MTQHQCTAALALAECIPHCPVLLCKTVSQQALCNCKYTYEGLLFIQVCSDPTPVNCSTGFGRMHSPLSSAALQNSLTACMCHCKYTYEGLLFTQVCNDPAPMHCTLALANCIPDCPVLLCKTLSQHACVTVNAPIKVCCSYKCAVTQHQCTAALALAECIPHCPVLLCKTVSQQALCHCKYTYEGLLFIQVCSDPTPGHCSTGFGRMHSPLSSAALRNSLTTGTVLL